MIMLKDYVVIDLEMTGLNAKTDRILELGAVRIRDGKQTAFFSEIINPGVELSEKIIELTGITNEDAHAGKAAEETIPLFLSFLGEDVLVGQNILFDYSFLKQWAVNHNMIFEKSAVDTLKLARKFLPAEQKKNLESLCCYYGIERKNAHRAYEDALETARIFEKMKQEFGEVEPEAFEPKPLQYKVKKQSPATERQKKYLQQLVAYHGISDIQIPEGMTRNEASRLTDQLIARYGKLPDTARLTSGKGQEDG